MASLNLYIVTFNCAATLVHPEAFKEVLFDELDNDHPLPDVLVVCLQEIAPTGPAFLGGSFLARYFNSFRNGVKLAAATRDNMSYVNIMARNVGTTAIMIFVHQDRKNRVVSVDTAGVGFGIWNMGNKGAVAARLGYLVDDRTGEIMEMTFVSAHLAAHEGQKYLRRRNNDWRSLVRGLVFSSAGRILEQEEPEDEDDESRPLLQPIPHENTNNFYQGADFDTREEDFIYGIYKPTSHLFIAGDFNYRTAGSKPTIEEFYRFPQPTPDRRQLNHYAQLLPHDELMQEMAAGRVMQGLSEARIDFPPTFKYNTRGMKKAIQDDELEWPWKKNRWPSWCDRVLWMELPAWMRSTRAGGIKIHRYGALPLLKYFDHRAVALSASLPAKAIPWPTGIHIHTATPDRRVWPPYNLNPRWTEMRASARRLEVVVGIVYYLFTTWEGRVLLSSVVVGGLGGYFLVWHLLGFERAHPEILQ
jgi:hypothetical protein